MELIIMPQELPIPTTTITLDWSKVSDKIKEYKEFLASFGGKKGHNPYLYWKHNLAPLEARLKKGEQTKELWDLIMNHKLVAPTIDTFPDQNYKTTLDEIPSSFKEIQKDQPPIDPVKFMDS